MGNENGDIPPYSYSPSSLMANYNALKVEEAAKCGTLHDPAAQPVVKKNNGSSFVVAAVQLTASGLGTNDMKGFWERAKEAVNEGATTHGANIILLPELFLGPYFCQSQEAALMGLAEDVTESFIVSQMQELAKKHSVVIPVSLYERKNNALYNSVVVIDADGSILGTYRKTHIPDGTGYQEKFYFTPGDTGFKVWKTKYGKLGVAICWDQWFPEAARSLALQGADLLYYPTAIGSEPQDPTINSADHWQRTMQGHSAANMVPVVASNRYGTEILLRDDGTEKQRIKFYGRTFITDNTGKKVAEVTEPGDKAVSILTSTIDPVANSATRLAWGLFRDRRPDLYGVLMTKDGGK